MQKAFPIILFVCILIGCRGKPRSAADRKAQLFGRWAMVFGDDCKDYGLKSDNLILRPDGTFNQIVVANDGRRYEGDSQHWDFVAPDSIWFDKRRNFFTDQDYKDLVGVPESESLIVKFDSPPTILLDPGSDCFYTKTQ